MLPSLTGTRRRLLVAVMMAGAIGGGLWLWTIYQGGQQYPAPSPQLAVLGQALLKTGGTSCTDASRFKVNPAAVEHIRLVCVSPDRVDFRVSADPQPGGLTYVNDPRPTELFAAQCVRHLSGPWWLYAEPSPNCPFGTFLQGG